MISLSVQLQERTSSAGGTRAVAVRAARVGVGVGGTAEASVVVVVARAYVSLVAKACSADWFRIACSVTRIVFVTMRANSSQII